MDSGNGMQFRSRNKQRFDQLPNEVRSPAKVEELAKIFSGMFDTNA
jgi:hypothetical protein